MMICRQLKVSGKKEPPRCGGSFKVVAKSDVRFIDPESMEESHNSYDFAKDLKVILDNDRIHRIVFWL